MAISSFGSIRPPGPRSRRWCAALALTLIAGLAASHLALAANNSVQGAKKDDGGLDIDAPTAILIEAQSGSVLFEKMPTS